MYFTTQQKITALKKIGYDPVTERVFVREERSGEETMMEAVVVYNNQGEAIPFDWSAGKPEAQLDAIFNTEVSERVLRLFN